MLTTTLKNGTTTVRITNIGCSIMSIHTPDRNGVLDNIVAGFADPKRYLDNPWYFGCIAGRYANRIGAGRFSIDGKDIQLTVNNGGNHLHGGFAGFHKKAWNIEHANDSEVLFTYTSPDGEEGYPGELHAQVRYALDANNKLALTYTATTDKRTPVNLTNHSYFNLSGFRQPTIADHQLMVRAARFTEKNGDNLPTGRILPVSGTPLDLSSPTALGPRIAQLPADKGFDHNFVLDGKGLAAVCYEQTTGRILRIYTDQPGIQVYTANWWDGAITGAHEVPYQQHGGVALETQGFPDSPNQPGFPNTILDPGETYQANTVFEFDVIK